MNLGRYVNHDPRSRDFVAPVAPAITSVKHPAAGLPLDQGSIGSCTANALVGAMNCTPGYPFKHGPFTEKGAVNLYELETRLEGQPYPPNDPGGSGLEVCKAAQQLRWISSYTHAFSLNDALLALVLRPVITGVDWYTSFDSPDATGVVTITHGATVRGGHEIVADEINVDKQLVGFWNSWGSSWGLAGRFYMPFATWGTLLSQQGDVTVPLP